MSGSEWKVHEGIAQALMTVLSVLSLSNPQITQQLSKSISCLPVPARIQVFRQRSIGTSIAHDVAIKASHHSEGSKQNIRHTSNSSKQIEGGAVDCINTRCAGATFPAGHESYGPEGTPLAYSGLCYLYVGSVVESCWDRSRLGLQFFK